MLARARATHSARGLGLSVDQTPASQPAVAAAASDMMAVVGWLAERDGRENRPTRDSSPRLGQPEPPRPRGAVAYGTGVIQRWSRRAHRPDIGHSRPFSAFKGRYLRPNTRPDRCSHARHPRSARTGVAECLGLHVRVRGGTRAELNPLLAGGNILLQRAEIAMAASLAGADARFHLALDGNGGRLTQPGPMTPSCATSTAWG